MVIQMIIARIRGCRVYCMQKIIVAAAFLSITPSVESGEGRVRYVAAKA